MGANGLAGLRTVFGKQASDFALQETLLQNAENPLRKAYGNDAKSNVWIILPDVTVHRKPHAIWRGDFANARISGDFRESE